MLRARVTGEVDMFQIYASEDVTISAIRASLCFAVS